jgi:phosphoglycerate dehydrogenase-like enzyme
MSKPTVLLLDEIQDDTAAKLNALFPALEFFDARDDAVRTRRLAEAQILYGFLPLDRFDETRHLRWQQLLSAGVARRLCAIARERKFIVTNLAGLYGPSIAEHTLTVMAMLARNLHLAMRNQVASLWDNGIAKTMSDLAGKTVAVIGLGDIGRSVARLAQAFGMRVIGSRRTVQPTPWVDQVYAPQDLRPMLAEADFVVIAAPLTGETETLLKAEQFAWMKAGVFLVNVSRGAVVDEPALLEALHSGRVAGAALDVFLKEPLPADHPYWKMPQVILTPHYCGDPVNNSTLPLERFQRNLRAWCGGKPLEAVVDLERGY